MRAPDTSVRIAVTGVGIVCSIGRNQAEVWQAIVDSRAGIAELTRFPGEAFPTSIAAEVTGEPGAGGRAAKRLSRTDRLAITAAREAAAQADAGAIRPFPVERTVVSAGTSTGGLLEGEDYFFRRGVHGRRRAPASLVMQQPTSAPADAIARSLGTGGGVISNATACASSAGSVGMAADLLRARYADAAIAGGADALCRLTYSGFNVLQAVDPEPCSPFSAGRRGITLGEGAGFLVLERFDDAVARGATILAELAGYGASCDAHHPTAPAEDGHGAESAIRGALREGSIGAAEVQYVNAHGTGTTLNDSAETRAIEAALGPAVPVSSTKSYFGHTLGAAGGIEAVITVLALQHQVAPPTLRLHAAGPGCSLDYVPLTPRPLAMRNALSNSFGFGGSNVALLFRRA